MKLISAQTQLRKLADPAIAEHSLRFFKTGKGEYGEGDKFLGVRMPTIRECAKQNKELPLEDVISVLHSSYHEERMLALVILVNKFVKGDDILQREIYRLYLENTEYVNGWDLVDSSAHQIVGGYLFERNRRKLLTLSKSKSLWERRISIIATYHFIKKCEFEDTLVISQQLLNDKEDLIHKAVGWMLREVGNRDKQAEVRFLKKHYNDMPRTMLRYAIEKFDKQERDQYLRAEV